ncbi:disintegrin and metalloproteinase domain-containing protein 12-like [Stegostoma tigrinum]|uniref:disintegrin and metalloproteinase domain-containing protein 12-like n=1 Tax=Stegostoma tigrinum TaxID=3053191 RepID=UPI002870532E|nr:disintegrin and metalloproteinase domain-containing protein 12-like [Stegostoma tigrinum]
MSECKVRLAILIWCQVLNLSAVQSEESAIDDGNRGNGRLFTVPSNSPTSHSPGAGWETKSKGATSGEQGTASGLRFRQEKLLEELKDYKFVFPQLVPGRGKRSVAVLPQMNYPNNLSILVELEGNNFTLDLNSNKFLLPRGFQVSHYDSNGSLVTETDTEMYRCYYVGFVRTFPGSQVSASTCSGLSALIVFSNRTYVIEPVVGDANGRHLLYRPEDLRPVPSICGVRAPSPELTLTDHLQRSQRVKRDVLSETKFIELVLVADREEYQNLGSDRDAVVQRMIDIANTVDLYYRPFNIRVALIGVEVWTANKITIDRSAKDNMNRFLNWRRNDLLPRMHNDNAHLITGVSFSHDLTGLASLSGMCSVENSGGVNSDGRPSFLAIAATLAHEMGHNLGMVHDSQSRGCRCLDSSGGCIMEALQRFPLPTMFSSCSRADLMRALRRGVGACLFNAPDLSRLVGPPECGNLYVDEGEECDCGSAADCDDPCCDPSTCTLKPGAKCSSSGSCCKDCEFLPAGTMCRGLMGECDLPEFCTGNFSNCPENVYLQDGHTCSNGILYCSNGICQSADKQCQEIWGPGATSAENICYSLTNKAGNKYGNCGKNENHTYIGCAEKDVKCGKIQCKGGNSSPVRGGNVDVLNTNFAFGGVMYKCRATFSTLPDSNIPDLIRAGTRCDHNKACYEKKCQDVSVFNVKTCDDACHDKGVCNSKGNCHCELGWAPPHCDVEGIGGSIDSGPMMYPLPVGACRDQTASISPKLKEVKMKFIRLPGKALLTLSCDTRDNKCKRHSDKYFNTFNYATRDNRYSDSKRS